MSALGLVNASITEGLVTSISHYVRDGGLLAIVLLMALGAACIPIPSEVVMLFAGFAVADPGAHGAGAHHHLTMAGIVLAGLAGSMLGSWAAYGVGRAGRLELLERHGRLLHVGPSQIRRADEWFRRYGGATVLVGRVVPFVRAFVSLPAGVARMGLVSFSVLTAIGSVVWVAALAFAGQALGSEWKSVRSGFEYVDYVIVALIVVGAIYAVVHRRRAGHEALQPAAAGRAEPVVEPAVEPAVDAAE